MPLLPCDGVGCKNAATHRLVGDDGEPVACWMCEACGQRVVDEYQNKLQETWRLAPCDRYGRLLPGGLDA